MNDQSMAIIGTGVGRWEPTGPIAQTQRKKSVRASLIAFGLGLMQAIQLPVIGYISLLELCFMAAVPFIVFTSQPFSTPQSVMRLVYLMIAYGALGLVVDVATEAEPLEAARQVVSAYLMIACLLCIAMLCVRWLGHFRWFLAGYGLWPVLKLVLGPEIAGGQEIWYAQPWSYGLGTGLPILVLCILPDAAGRGPRIAAAAVLLVFVAVGLLHDDRSTALLTLIVAAVLIALRPESERGFIVTPARWTAAAIVAAFAGGAGLAAYATLAGSGALGPEAQATYQQQFDNPYGAAVAIRPDFVVGLEAVARRPLFGYGSTQEGAAEFIARRAQLVLQRGLGDRDFSLITRGKIPSHSILLNAWIQVGVLGGLLWLYLLAMTITTIPMAATSSSPLGLVCLYLCLVNAWVILFSPGPARIDVALGLAVMFAFREQTRVRAHEPG